VEVNGRKVNIPSYQVGVGDTIKVRPNSAKLTVVESSREIASHSPAPAWLQIDGENLSGRVIALPKREDISIPVNEQLIVELYSK
jgi:small subunit ribosomal protein S4